MVDAAAASRQWTPVKHSDVASAVDQTAEPPAPPRSPREPLVMRLSFKPHMTDLVRAFRYERVNIDEARKRLRTLSDRFGEDVVADAADELLQIESQNGTHVAFLKTRVRELARSILGPPPKEGAPQSAAPVPKDKSSPETAQSPSSELDADDIDGAIDLRDDDPPDDVGSEHLGAVRVRASARLVPHDAVEAKGKPVRLPHREVLTHFVKWIAASGQEYDLQNADELRTFAPHVRTVPDFILIGCGTLQRVSIRPKLSTMQRHDLTEWPKVYGVHYAVARVWPMVNGDGWVWTVETIVEALSAPTDASNPKAVSGLAVADPQQAAAPESLPISVAIPAKVETGRTPAANSTTASSDPGKLVDLAHVAHRLDLLQEDIDDEKLARIEASKRIEQLQSEIDAVRDQLRRVEQED